MAVVLRCVDRYAGRQYKNGAFFGFVGQKNAALLLIQPEYRLKSRRTAIMGGTPMLQFGPPNLPPPNPRRSRRALFWVVARLVKIACMPSPLPSGKYTFANTKLTGSEFNDVCLGGATFENVRLENGSFHDINLKGVRFDDVNLSNASITNANLAGMTINGVLVTELFAAYQKVRTGH